MGGNAEENTAFRPMCFGTGAEGFCYGFSQLRALEFFVFRKMEMPETQNPPAMRVESICL